MYRCSAYYTTVPGDIIPLHRLRKVVAGFVAYDTTTMSGKMYPHVFARFQKVFFDANFDFEHTHMVELWIDDDTHDVNTDDASLIKEMKDAVEGNFREPVASNL
jgi:hypothetical protein